MMRYEVLLCFFLCYFFLTRDPVFTRFSLALDHWSTRKPIIGNGRLWLCSSTLTVFVLALPFLMVAGWFYSMLFGKWNLYEEQPENHKY